MGIFSKGKREAPADEPPLVIATPIGTYYPSEAISPSEVGTPYSYAATNASSSLPTPATSKINSAQPSPPPSRSKYMCDTSFSAVENLCECTPPEVCGPDAEDSKQQHLLTHTTGDNDEWLTKFLKRDKPLLVAIAAMVLLMNFGWGNLSYILYPFKIFSTWIHELCHCVAAVLVGGGIDKFLLYPDTSGLAYTYTNGSNFSRGFVASAGYTGTAFWGMLMLLFRRTHRGPTVGIISLGIIILLSCILWVRTIFGVVMMVLMAIAMIICAFKLRAKHLAYLYSFLAATTSFNAVENIHDLYGVGYVNGQEVESDAHAVADVWGGGTYAAWASLWLGFALVCSAVGLLCAFDGHTYKEEKKQKTKQQQQQKDTQDDLRYPAASAPVNPAFNDAPTTRWPLWKSIV